VIDLDLIWYCYLV